MAFMETHQEIPEPNNTASVSFRDLSTKCSWQLEKTALSCEPDVWEGIRNDISNQNNSRRHI